jgi:hypothetical protein
VIVDLIRGCPTEKLTYNTYFKKEKDTKKETQQNRKPKASPQQCAAERKFHCLRVRVRLRSA